MHGYSFERTKKRSKAAVNYPAVRLITRSRMGPHFSFNAPARRDLFAGVEYVLILYDAQRETVAFKPTSTQDRDAYRVRPNADSCLVVSAGAFVAQFGLEDRRYRWSRLQAEGGYLVSPP